MKRQLARGGSLLAFVLFLAPSSSAANPLDIPAAVPPEFRALVRERLHRERPSFKSESRFALEAQGGYRLSVIAVEDIVAVEVAKGASLTSLVGSDEQGGTTATVYVARGTVTPRRIAASFEGLGRIAVRFRPSGRVVQSPPRRRCKGPDRFTSRLGVFVGRIPLQRREGLRRGPRPPGEGTGPQPARPRLWLGRVSLAALRASRRQGLWPSVQLPAGRMA